MQLDEALSQPASRAQLVASTISRLRAGEPPDLLVSAGTEALVLTSLVAAELGLPMVYVRPEAKGHGRQKRLEGEPRGSRAAVISGDEAAADDCRQEIESSGVRVVQVLTPATPAEVSPQEVARILLDIGAVIIRQEPFRYVSGILSPIYTDCRLLISYPEQWGRVLDALLDKLTVVEFDAIAGVATSGIPHASVLAQRTGKPLAYVAGESVVGALGPNAQLVMIEDLITTGKSVLAATGVLRDHGLRMDRCVAIFTYERQQPGLEAANIHVERLCDLETLLEVGQREGFFGQAERDAVLDWRRDPQGWTARHESPTG